MSKNDNGTTKVSKNTSKKNTTKSQNKSNKNNNTKKVDSKNSTKKATNKTTSNKKTTNTIKKSVNSRKKTINKKDDIKVVKHEPTVVEEVKLKKVNDLEAEVFEPISEVSGAKIENAKFTIRKRNKTAIAIGVFISLLGIIALIIALIANRIVDREFISDNQVIVMVVISIIIELMGAAIIIKET